MRDGRMKRADRDSYGCEGYFTRVTVVIGLPRIAPVAFIIPFSFHSKRISRLLKNVPHNLVEAGVLRYYGLVWELDMVRMERSYMS